MSGLAGARALGTVPSPPDNWAGRVKDL
jgi:hypothetical protein